MIKKQVLGTCLLGTNSSNEHVAGIPFFSESSTYLSVIVHASIDKEDFHSDVFIQNSKGQDYLKVNICASLHVREKF